MNGKQKKVQAMTTEIDKDELLKEIEQLTGCDDGAILTIAEKQNIRDYIVKKGYELLSKHGPFKYFYYFSYVNDAMIHKHKNGTETSGHWEATPDFKIVFDRIPERIVSQRVNGLNSNFNPIVTTKISRKGDKDYDIGVKLSDEIKDRMENIALWFPRTRLNLYLFADYNKDNLYKKLRENNVPYIDGSYVGQMHIETKRFWFHKKKMYLFMQLEIGNE